ncbi:hypothetical protein SAY87_017809 [Trapa incisa]|uniref:Uncharacterized protein n=1 Tax=Trapa incisa TaxID=236973 RepID=A0AAN7LAZ2_9MYRT|nr:hypothetical protein SAY87_017809 [Trapa incisa]
MSLDKDGLTEVAMEVERTVVEAEHLGEALEVRVLNHKVPLRVVPDHVEVSNCDLHSPVGLVALFYVPVDPYRAHVVRAPHQIRQVLCWIVRHLQQRHHLPVPEKKQRIHHHCTSQHPYDISGLFTGEPDRVLWPERREEKQFQVSPEAL